MTDPVVLAAIATGLTSAIGGYAIARRTTRPAEVTAESATANSLLASYDAYAERLEKRVEQVSNECEKRIAALEAQHENERREWREERDRLNDRIDEMGAQLYALLNRPPHTRERGTDR